MASIRKRNGKWQAQVRRKNQPALSRSFGTKRDAQVWARQIEEEVDRTGAIQTSEVLESITLRELVVRYRDGVLHRKQSGDRERQFLNAFLCHPICTKRLPVLRTEHFATYRDERLKQVKPASLSGIKACTRRYQKHTV